MKIRLLIIVHMLIVGCTPSDKLEDQNSAQKSPHTIVIVDNRSDSKPSETTCPGGSIGTTTPGTGTDSSKPPTSDNDSTTTPPTLPKEIQDSIKTGLDKLCYSQDMYPIKYVSLAKDMQQYTTGAELHITTDQQGYIFVDVEIDGNNSIYGGDAHKGQLMIIEDSQFDIVNIPNKNGYTQVYKLMPSVFYQRQIQSTRWESLRLSSVRRPILYLVKEVNNKLELIRGSSMYYDSMKKKYIVTPKKAILPMNAQHFIKQS